MVFKISTDGTMEANPIPTENTGDDSKVASIQYNAAIGKDVKNIIPLCWNTNRGESMNG